MCPPDIAGHNYSGYIHWLRCGKGSSQHYKYRHNMRPAYRGCSRDIVYTLSSSTPHIGSYTYPQLLLLPVSLVTLRCWC